MLWRLTGVSPGIWARERKPLSKLPTSSVPFRFFQQTGALTLKACAKAKRRRGSLVVGAVEERSQLTMLFSGETPVRRQGMGETPVLLRYEH
jgi:hypothetical protein